MISFTSGNLFLQLFCSLKFLYQIDGFFKSSDVAPITDYKSVTFSKVGEQVVPNFLQVSHIHFQQHLKICKVSLIFFEEIKIKFTGYLYDYTFWHNLADISFLKTNLPCHFYALAQSCDYVFKALNEKNARITERNLQTIFMSLHNSKANYTFNVKFEILDKHIVNRPQNKIN